MATSALPFSLPQLPGAPLKGDESTLVGTVPQGCLGALSGGATSLPPISHQARALAPIGERSPRIDFGIRKKRRPLLTIDHSGRSPDLASGGSKLSPPRCFYSLTHKGLDYEKPDYQQARLGFRRPRDVNIRLRPLEKIKPYPPTAEGSTRVKAFPRARLQKAAVAAQPAPPAPPPTQVWSPSEETRVSPPAASPPLPQAQNLPLSRGSDQSQNSEDVQLAVFTDVAKETIAAIEQQGVQELLIHRCCGFEKRRYQTRDETAMSSTETVEDCSDTEIVFDDEDDFVADEPVSGQAPEALAVAEPTVSSILEDAANLVLTFQSCSEGLPSSSSKRRNWSPPRPGATITSAKESHTAPAQESPLSVDEDQKSAAIQIQSRHRGKQARREVELRRSNKAQQDSCESHRQDAPAISGDEAQTTAAIQIQSRHRGKQARREVELRRLDTTKQEEAPVSPNDEQASAALQIQSRHRGKQARREVQQRRADMAKQDEEQQHAVLRIQSTHRGKLARRQVDQIRHGVEASPAVE